MADTAWFGCRARVAEPTQSSADEVASRHEEDNHRYSNCGASASGMPCLTELSGAKRADRPAPALDAVRGVGVGAYAWGMPSDGSPSRLLV